MKDRQIIQVFGLGYIGLPLTLSAVNSGLNVRGIDVSSRVISCLKNGQVPIEEPGLQEALDEALVSGRLRLSQQAEPADIHVIAVPTPVDMSEQPDISVVEDVARVIKNVARQGDLVIIESTCPVGTANTVAAIVNDGVSILRSEIRVHVASCPERILPGLALQELKSNDRVIGGVTPKCAEKASAFYKVFCDGELHISETANAAELVKLTENSYRDVNIAFANELSKLCDAANIDVWDVIQLANMHPRVNILQPGAGVGGHCIAVDPWFLVHAFPNQTALIKTARKVNDDKPLWVVSKVRSLLNNRDSLTPLKIAIFGLTFKPDVDDIRESPSLKIATLLADESGCVVAAVEPHLEDLTAELLDAGVTSLDSNSAIKWADCCLILVRHSSFTKVKDRLREHNNVIDVCGLLSDI